MTGQDTGQVVRTIAVVQSQSPAKVNTSGHTQACPGMARTITKKSIVLCGQCLIIIFVQSKFKISDFSFLAY